MTQTLIAAGVVIGLWALSCPAMMLFAHRLPPGLLRDIAEFLPACVTTARTLRNSPAVPRRAKVALLIRYAARSIPRDTLLEAWPANLRLLERLLGSRRSEVSD